MCAAVAEAGFVFVEIGWIAAVAVGNVDVGNDEAGSGDGVARDGKLESAGVFTDSMDATESDAGGAVGVWSVPEIISTGAAVEWDLGAGLERPKPKLLKRRFTIVVFGSLVELVLVFSPLAG